MPAAPRVYSADVDGVHEWIVAAANQRAALDALGVHQDLFAQGRAQPEKDPAKVEAARARPGVPLRRAKGSKEGFEPAGGGEAGWSAALKAAPKGGLKAKPSKGARPAKAAGVAKAGGKAARPKGPSAADRRALRDAEAALRAFEREAVKALAALDAERHDLDRRERSLTRGQDRRRATLQRAVDKARSSVEDPR